MKQNPITRRALALSSIALTALALSSIGTVAAAQQQLLKPDGKPADMKKSVKVFILMGQSNMVGMGDNRYEQNLVNLIKSLRKDYNAPNARFVLAVGCGNPGRTGGGLQVAEAQLAMNDARKHPEFDGNVKCVDSRDFWREVLVSPKDQGHHYNRNAETYMEVGLSLGQAMADLFKNQK